MALARIKVNPDGNHKRCPCGNVVLEVDNRDKHLVMSQKMINKLKRITPHDVPMFKVYHNILPSTLPTADCGFCDGPDTFIQLV